MAAYKFSKCSEESGLGSAGYSKLQVFEGGCSVVTVYFDVTEDCEALEGTSYLLDNGVLVSAVSGGVFDLLCEFRKQDEAPVMGADSSSKCTQGGAA
ncbi:TPA: hypothetical protein ACGFXW_000008 [Vibrio cholerae]